MSNYDVEKGACFGGLEEAIQYAVIKHSGQVRKGTDIPYIVHPLEVMTLLAAMRAEKETVIAGVLHDTIEDTDATYEDTREFYWEFVDRFKDVFVSFYIDDEEPVLYQQSADGEAYELNCTECVWKPASGKIPESAIQINRREAEFAEDRWKDVRINGRFRFDID